MDIRLPAEWEKHEATWLVWPQRNEDWPGKFSSIKWVYSEIIKKIAESERVKLIVDSHKIEKQAKRILAKTHVDLSVVDFYKFKTDRSWIRDTGPFFYKDDNRLRAVCFSFNAWGRYKDFQNDNKIPREISDTLNIQSFIAAESEVEVILEGGSIDVNGRGTLITTEQCLLSNKRQIRNIGFDKHDYERVFNKLLGIKRVIWLKNGISGDDTNGHIDDFCRFVNQDTVILCQEKNPKDSNYKVLNENRELLKGMETESGSKIQVINIPMPQPVYFDEQRLPASYVNFYITNSYVLVPTFNDPNDYKAIGILKELFRDREAIGINCTDLIWGLGAIHCITKEQTAV